MAKYDLKNNPELARERHREQARQYYYRNREKCYESHRRWIANNPGYIAQYARDRRMLSKMEV